MSRPCAGRQWPPRRGSRHDHAAVRPPSARGPAGGVRPLARHALSDSRRRGGPHPHGLGHLGGARLRPRGRGRARNPLSFVGYNLEEAGATAVQELGLVFAHARAVVRELVRRGLEGNRAPPRLSFFFAASNDFFEQVAKYRAARRIWHRMTGEEGGRDPRARALRFHVQTSGVALTAQLRRSTSFARRTTPWRRCWAGLSRSTSRPTTRPWASPLRQPSRSPSAPSRSCSTRPT